MPVFAGAGSMRTSSKMGTRRRPAALRFDLARERRGCPTESICAEQADSAGDLVALQMADEMPRSGKIGENGLASSPFLHAVLTKVA